MTSLLLPVTLGGLAGAGLYLTIRQLVPAHPDLRGALQRLSVTTATAHQAPSGTLTERVGERLQLPGLTVPTADLAITRTTYAQWMGQKVLCAMLGLAIPTALTAVLSAAGTHVPLLLPAIIALAAATALFLAPDFDLRAKASRARHEFTRAVTVYIELTALERSAASGTVQAMHAAAGVAGSWPFLQIRERLLRAQLDGVPPWDALDELSRELDVQSLGDVAATMRLAGSDGAQTYASLRALGRGLRTTELTGEHARANAASETMGAPNTVAGMLFVILLVVPALMRLA